MLPVNSEAHANAGSTEEKVYVIIVGIVFVRIKSNLKPHIRAEDQGSVMSGSKAVGYSTPPDVSRDP